MLYRFGVPLLSYWSGRFNSGVSSTTNKSSSPLCFNTVYFISFTSYFSPACWVSFIRSIGLVLHMDNQGHKRTHIPAHESHGVHLCHKCGWPFPNPHPSAKHRRAHKKICGTIKGYKLLDSEGHTHSNASDDSDDDHKIPSPDASEISKNEKGGGGIGEKINRSEDEVFSDAVADFSESVVSSDSAISVVKVDRKVPKFTEPSEDKGFDPAGVSQLTVKSSDEFQMQSPEGSQSEGVEVGETLELQGQPSGFIVESSLISDSYSRTKASTVVHSNDSLGLPSKSHLSEAESISDVIPETGDNVIDCSLNYAAEESNLKGKDEIETDKDMVEIVVSSNNVVGEISERLSKLEVSDKGNSGSELADGAATVKGKNIVESSSVLPQDDLLPLDVVSVVNTNTPTNVVQLESEHMLQFATSSDQVKAFQEKEDVNVHTLSNPDLAHSQSEFDNGPGGEGVALQNPFSLHSSEALKHEEDDLKEIVTEEYRSNFVSNQLTVKKEVLSLDMHVLDDSIKQECINCEPTVQVITDVSSVKNTVDGDQRSIEIGSSEDSMKSEINKSSTMDSYEEPGSDDAGKNLQHINLLEGSIMVSSDNFEDFKDCEEEVSLNSLNNLHSSEALKDKEDDLKDAVDEENHSNFKLSQFSKESMVISPDMCDLDDIIKQEQVHCEPKVDDTLAEGQAEVSPVTLTAESNRKSDEIGASENNANTEKNESHVVHILREQKFDDICRTSQEKRFPVVTGMGSSNENPRDVSIGSSTGQTSVISIGEISHYETNRNESDDVAVDGKCRGGDEESDIGIRVETLQPSDLLQLEARTDSDVFKSDYAGERSKITKCDKTETHGMKDPLLKDNLLPNSGSSQCESSIVPEDVIDGHGRKSTIIDNTNIDAVSGTKEDVKGDKIINSEVQEECNRFVGTLSNLHQAQDTELSSKSVDEHAKELPSHSPLDTEQSAQSVPAVEPSGEASGISIVTAQDRSVNSLVKFGSSGIDASVESSSWCDSLEGNWGSVSVLSVQSDAPAILDGEALRSIESEKSNLNNSEAAPEGQRSEKSEMFEPPSFMTLVEPGQVVGQKAAASEGQTGHNPEQLNPNSSQAGWFPTLTQVINESQGRKKNEEIIAKVTNWRQHTPLKSLLGEAANNNKPKSPKLEENQASPKNGSVPKDNGSGLTTVNSILGPESPTAQAMKGEAGKEWNSPARYPADIKREKRKVKSRPYWIQFVCCSSVDHQ